MVFFFFLATIPLTIRRLHDTGRSAWWVGIGIILKVSFVISLIFDIITTGINFPGFIGNIFETTTIFFAKYTVWSLIIFIYQIVLLVLVVSTGKCKINDLFEEFFFRG
ncbi:DUF805 domain-containing protein [Prevotella sp. PCHR]|uniref:DUF805 domain-containing protein n=1 Tax=Xylanibacter caecicola TaxID=2736294 RepID=A0ABX2B882_9BACT|nr:DUF805 domain-containing protein [Xylanibacter caecicola]